MPLEKSKSPKAFEKNVKAEVKAGKPVKQAVAIAYSEKKEAEKRDRKEDKKEKICKRCDKPMSKCTCK